MTTGEARVIPRDEHIISRSRIDPDALKVLYRLNQKGHKAYIVGGGVRDLLLGERPKDFDVATDARPREVKRMFRNCWLIGRRFRLAHVKFGPNGEHVIEVSTFRSPPVESEDGEVEMLADDNVFGTPQSDALRRDFTVNALFYSVEDFSVIDWVDGYEDLRRRVVRSIGDPFVRYREDPVRMLRAIKFARRLDFDIAPDDLAALTELAPLLGEVSESRLTDEVYKLFKTRRSAEICAGLDEYHLADAIAPHFGNLIASEGGQRVLAQVDELEAANKPLDRCMIWAALIEAWDAGDNIIDHGNPVLAVRDKVSVALKKLRVSKRDTDIIRRVLIMTGRMRDAGINVKGRLLRQSLCGMALTFWKLALDRGEGDDAEAWSAWSEARERTGDSSEGSGRPRRRRRRRRRRRKKKSS